MGLEDSGMRRTLVERPLAPWDGRGLEVGVWDPVVGVLDAGDSVKVAGYLSRDLEF